MHRITLPVYIHAEGLPAFLGLIGQQVSDEDVVVDFGPLRRVSPAGMVSFIATIKRWQGEGHKVFFENTEICPIMGYLQRMDLFNVCDLKLPEKFVRHESTGRFVPVKRIEHPVEALGSEMAKCVAPGGDDYGHPMSPLYDLTWYVLTEAANNARQHSGGTGFASAQVISTTGLVRLAIADNGKGVLGSFRDAGFPWASGLDDAGAIRRALEPFISSKGSPTNEGVGLTLVSGLAQQTKAWLLIVSGNAMLTMDNRGNTRTILLPNRAEYKGTMLALTIPQHTVKNFADLLTAAKIAAGLLRSPGITGNFET